KARYRGRSSNVLDWRPVQGRQTSCASTVCRQRLDTLTRSLHSLQAYIETRSRKGITHEPEFSSSNHSRRSIDSSIAQTRGISQEPKPLLFWPTFGQPLSREFRARQGQRHCPRWEPDQG